MKREHAIYLLWGDNFENRDSMMKQSHSLWYAAPSKNPRWLQLRMHTHIDCSVLLMSAYLSPVNANPPASYKPLFLFKHHLHPLCLLQTLPLNPHFPHSVTSYPGQHGETQIISNHSDLSLIQAPSNRCGGGEDAGGGENGSIGWACSLNAWTLHTCSITSSVLLRFTNPTDGRAPLAMRHVRLCILQRRTNRAGSSATPVYCGACVLSKLCFAGAQNSAEIGLLELFHSLQIDVECPGQNPAP